MAKKTLKISTTPKATLKKASSSHPARAFCNCSQFCHKKLTLRARKRHYKNAGRSFSDSEGFDPDIDMDNIVNDSEFE
jgi:hypothetical protein